MVNISELIRIQQKNLLQMAKDSIETGCKASATVRPAIEEMKAEFDKIKNNREEK